LRGEDERGDDRETRIVSEIVQRRGKKGEERRIIGQKG
jgi:hypothetical protein